MTWSVTVKVTRSERWLYPCAGSSTPEVVGDDVKPDYHSNPAFYGRVLKVDSEAGGVDSYRRPWQNEPIVWNRMLNILTKKTVRLKQKVRALKKLYVSEISKSSVSFLSSQSHRIVITIAAESS